MVNYYVDESRELQAAVAEIFARVARRVVARVMTATGHELDALSLRPRPRGWTDQQFREWLLGGAPAITGEGFAFAAWYRLNNVHAGIPDDEPAEGWACPFCRSIWRERNP